MERAICEAHTEYKLYILFTYLRSISVQIRKRAESSYFSSSHTYFTCIPTIPHLRTYTSCWWAGRVLPLRPVGHIGHTYLTLQQGLTYDKPDGSAGNSMYDISTKHIHPWIQPLLFPTTADTQRISHHKIFRSMGLIPTHCHSRQLLLQ